LCHISGKSGVPFSGEEEKTATGTKNGIRLSAKVSGVGFSTAYYVIALGRSITPTSSNSKELFIFHVTVA